METKRLSLSLFNVYVQSVRALMDVRRRSNLVAVASGEFDIDMMNYSPISFTILTQAQ